jgi:hypothetical protein
MNLYFKWRHQEGSIVEFTTNGWASDVSADLSDIGGGQNSLVYKLLSCCAESANHTVSC